MNTYIQTCILTYILCSARANEKAQSHIHMYMHMHRYASRIRICSVTYIQHGTDAYATMYNETDADIQMSSQTGIHI